jgi:hypothetical protein
MIPAMITLSQENIDRERKSRLFARDRNSSSSVGKSSKKTEKSGGAVLSPSQVQPDSTLAEVCWVELDGNFQGGLLQKGVF